MVPQKKCSTFTNQFLAVNSQLSCDSKICHPSTRHLKVKTIRSCTLLCLLAKEICSWAAMCPMLTPKQRQVQTFTFQSAPKVKKKLVNCSRWQSNDASRKIFLGRSFWNVC